MIFSIISENDIFFTPAAVNNSMRSSNPYDYIRCGYALDNASLFGGKNYVDFNSDIPSYRTSRHLDITDI